MWLVRAGTGSPPFLRPAPVGRAAICVGTDSQTGHPVIVEAAPRGVWSRSLRAGEQWAWAAEELTPHQRAQLVGAATQYDGVPYTWPSILGFLLRWWVKQWRGRAEDHSDAKLFCSELVAWLYRDCMDPGLDLFPGVSPRTTAPADLYRRMRERGWA